MPGVEELHFRIGIVPPEGFGTGRKEERMFLPHTASSGGR